jgi:tetratricopeptide (TPR) repeat protein
MKALIISNQGHEKEAFALAKVALNNNMKSHVCWHVYGLLYRAQKNFDESIKAYKFALKLDPESGPIQRDLAHLQIQMRDYQGYIQSRRNMLQQKPGFRQNWTALAIAHHLSGNLEEAENVLSTYEDTLKQTPPRTDMEHWEAVLYKNTIIAQAGNIEKALDHLEAVGKKSPDVLGVLEMKADYLLKLDRKSEAESVYVALLERNPENSAYYHGLIKSKGLSDGDADAAKKVYDELVEKFPKADLPRRRPLDFLEGDAFREAADAYLQRMLRKGVPSTFANIKHLYTNAEKRQIVQELAEGYASGKLATQANGSAEKTTNGDNNTRFDSSVLYFLAQHYNYHLSRNLTKALEYIGKAIESDPKSVDYHQTKARTLKYQGNISEAAELIDKARSLDERDRAINTKCAKYQLRNDENAKALDTLSKFTRNETAGGPLGDLHDMQCIWYLTEDGQSYLRQKKIGLALKRFHAAFNIFDIWQEDQFDFHNFSLRKGMIRAYIDMLRWEDRLRDHPFYSKLALSAVQAYVMLHDNPDLVHGPMMNGTNGVGKDGGADAAERKKALKKAKREQQKMEKAEADKKEALKASKSNAKSADGETKKEDDDPLGKTLAETKEPLQGAMKFLTPLLEFSPDNVEAQCAGFEVFLRRSTFPWRFWTKLLTFWAQKSTCWRRKVCLLSTT